ncbi:hypothetical protein NDU88_008839 [Pleurodeles waltl]|uniref:Uncharacterized protein n=1 Tax=Pleurodeles waltl TaxID=8319 RepID=A0AAV7PT95_PLEWA|nr:hypothetical protein NDU88_008839 [Pleurodeles waltl]
MGMGSSCCGGRSTALGRMHRAPARPQAPWRPPQPVVARLLHYLDRDTLLQRARKAGPFMVECGKVNMFPDFTVTAQAKRAYYMETPEEAWAWLESHPSGTDRMKFTGPQVPQHRRKSRRSRKREERMTKPTPEQVNQEKRTALQAAASLTESGHSDGEKGDTMDVPECDDMFDLNSVVSALEGAPHVTPQTASDLM